MHKEPNIVIDGKTLTEQQAMAVRVAIGHFMFSLSEENCLGDDEHGRFMQKAYRDRLTEVEKMILEKNNGK